MVAKLRPTGSIRSIEVIHSLLQFLRIKAKLLGQTLNGVTLLWFLVSGIIYPPRSERVHNGLVGDARTQLAALRRDMTQRTSMISGPGLLEVSDPG